MMEALNKLVQILTESQKPELQNVQGVDFITVPDGHEVKSLTNIIDEHRERPRFRATETSMANLLSFIDHLKRYVGPESVIYSYIPDVGDCRLSYRVMGVIDDHPAGPDFTKAGRCKNKVMFAPVVHSRMAKWLQVNNKFVEQKDFVLFLEDNVGDLIMKPETATLAYGADVATPSEIMSLARALEINVKKTVANHYRSESGETTFVFEQTNQRKDSEKASVPEWFYIKVPPFIGYDAVEMPVRLRYRLSDDGKLFFGISLFQFDLLLEQIVLATEDIIKTSLPEVHFLSGVRQSG